MSTTSRALTIWPFSLFGETHSVGRDAEALIRTCAGSALEMAERNARHEDFGWLPTVRAGHWDRVAREIARRIGRNEPAVAACVAA